MIIGDRQDTCRTIVILPKMRARKHSNIKHSVKHYTSAHAVYVMIGNIWFNSCPLSHPAVYDVGNIAYMHSVFIYKQLGSEVSVQSQIFALRRWGGGVLIWRWYILYDPFLKNCRKTRVAISTISPKQGSIYKKKRKKIALNKPIY